jgi:hypothetical protein
MKAIYMCIGSLALWCFLIVNNPVGTLTNVMATAKVATPNIEIPSSNRVEPGSVNLPIVNFSAVPTTKTADVESAVNEWVSRFNDAIQSGKCTSVADLFLEESYWRDHLSLSWDFHTLKGPANITAFLKNAPKGCRLKSITVDKSSSFKAPHVSRFDGAGQIQGVETFLITETDVGSGLGLVRLAQQGGKWKAFTLFTSMLELKGHEEAVHGRRPQGVDHGGQPGRKNWQERRNADSNYEHSTPTVLIVGKRQVFP